MIIWISLDQLSVDIVSMSNLPETEQLFTTMRRFSELEREKKTTTERVQKQNKEPKRVWSSIVGGVSCVKPLVREGQCV